jgi:hypothetical protein
MSLTTSFVLSFLWMKDTTAAVKVRLADVAGIQVGQTEGLPERFGTCWLPDEMENL